VPGDPTLAVPVVVHQIELFAPPVVPVGDEGDGGERDAATAREVEDDLVAEGMGDAAGDVELAAVELTEDLLAAREVVETALEGHPVLTDVADLAEQDHVVVQRAVELEVAPALARELEDGKDLRSLDVEDAAHAEVGAERVLDDVGRVTREGGECTLALEGREGQALAGPLMPL